jgi:hypothetical protein
MVDSRTRALSSLSPVYHSNPPLNFKKTYMMVLVITILDLISPLCNHILFNLHYKFHSFTIASTTLFIIVLYCIRPCRISDSVCSTSHIPIFSYDKIWIPIFINLIFFHIHYIYILII